MNRSFWWFLAFTFWIGLVLNGWDVLSGTGTWWSYVFVVIDVTGLIYLDWLKKNGKVRSRRVKSYS